MAYGSNLLLNGISGKLGIYSVYPLNGKTVIRLRGSFVRNNSDRQVQYQCTVRDLARAWRQTPLKTKAMWGKLALRMPRWDAKTAQTPLTGYQTFQSVAWGLRALGKDIPAVPLLVPDLPQPLPDVEVAANISPAGLQLTLSGGPFADACQIFACAPAAPGAKCKEAWSQIAVVTDWAGDAVDVGEVYAARFGVPEDGAVVWLKMVPISANGFRGQPLVRMAEVVENLPAPSLATGESSPTPSLAKPRATPPETGGEVHRALCGLSFSVVRDKHTPDDTVPFAVNPPSAAGGVACREERTQRRGGCPSPRKKRRGGRRRT